MSEHLSDIQKQWHLVHDAYHRGYNQGLKEGLAQGPTHPAVQLSVQRMFNGWDGADNARERSANQFWHEYRATNGGDRHE